MSCADASRGRYHPFQFKLLWLARLPHTKISIVLGDMSASLGERILRPRATQVGV